MIKLLETNLENLNLTTEEILIVGFVVLGIIGIISLIIQWSCLSEIKKGTTSEPKLEQNLESSTNNQTSKPVENKLVVIEDDDMLAAILVATIDYQQETNKDIRVVSVKKL